MRSVRMKVELPELELASTQTLTMMASGYSYQLTAMPLPRANPWVSAKVTLRASSVLDPLLLSCCLRDDPKKEPTAEAIVTVGVAHIQRLLFHGFPVAHVERVGDDPRTGLQIMQQLGTQP